MHLNLCTWIPQLILKICIQHVHVHCTVMYKKARKISTRPQDILYISICDYIDLQNCTIVYLRKFSEIS